MNGYDDKSEICGFASDLIDVADLYERAADKVGDDHLADSLRRWGARRRRMADVLLTKAGISGEPQGSLLPTPDEVWLELKALFSSADSALAAAVRSADEMVMVALESYLDHAQPPGSAAVAATWLHSELQRELGPTETRPDTSQKQPG